MRRPDPATPDINVTPLVDVVLVLLIIFMVVVPQMEAGAAVTLPGVKHPDPKTEVRNAPIHVSITRSGALFLEKTPMSRAQLLETLRELRSVAPGRRLILKGDRDARYADVRSIFRDCQALGFPGMSLAVGDKRSEERR